VSGATATLRIARQRLVVDSLGIWVIAIIVGGIFGFTARQGGLSLVEAIAFSSILFAGASQYAAVGLLVVNTPWPSIVLLVWLLNARHLLYSASVAPYTAKLSLKLRAALSFLLTDEAFALTTAHIARLGRIDVPAAWYAGLTIFIPWNVSTIAGWLAGAALPAPASIGLDVVFAAAMAGLAIGLVKDRAALAALVVGCCSSVVAALFLDSSAAIMIGGLLGPLAGLALFRRRA
jgi:predicted branched-subunit amino acid permease